MPMFGRVPLVYDGVLPRAVANTARLSLPSAQIPGDTQYEWVSPNPLRPGETGPFYPGPGGASGNTGIVPPWVPGSSVGGSRSFVLPLLALLAFVAWKAR